MPKAVGFFLKKKVLDIKRRDSIVSGIALFKRKVYEEFWVALKEMNTEKIYEIWKGSDYGRILAESILSLRVEKKEKRESENVDGGIVGSYDVKITAPEAMTKVINVMLGGNLEAIKASCMKELKELDGEASLKIRKINFSMSNYAHSRRLTLKLLKIRSARFQLRGDLNEETVLKYKREIY